MDGRKELEGWKKLGSNWKDRWKELGGSMEGIGGMDRRNWKDG